MTIALFRSMGLRFRCSQLPFMHQACADCKQDDDARPGGTVTGMLPGKQGREARFSLASR